MPRIPKYKLKPIDLTTEPIGQRIARIRKGKGLTQIELGEKIGVSQQLVASYEAGNIRLYDEMVARFSLALGVNSDILLGLKKPDKNPTGASLRVARRIREIEKLPEPRKKAILRTIDDLIRASK
jgi:transcriptional regulator with XRE-family HTH domain